jgi:hypothetical protein
MRPGAWGKAYEVASDSAEGPDASSEEWAPARTTDLLWTGRARCVRLSLDARAGARIVAPEVVFIDSSGFVRRRSVLASPASVERPPIVTRKMWGAREKLRNCPPYYARKLKTGFIHHTAGSNDYSRAQSDDVVRAIYYYHAQVRGWCDIGYNFLVDKYGTVFEGRAGGISRRVVPAAQQGFNYRAFAVSVMGNFENRRPSRAAIRSLKRLLAWRLDVAHLPPDGRARMVSTGGPNTRYPAGTRVRLRVLNGHRRTGLTACPGDELSRLIPRIRAAAERLGGPKIVRPRTSVRSFAAGSDGAVVRARSFDELSWVASISSGAGVVRSFEDRGTRLRFRWRGLDELGEPVEPGRYIVRITGETIAGESARPARVRLRVTE